MLLEKFFETDCLATGFSSVQEPPTAEQPIRLVMTTQQGPSFDPKGFDLTIEVVGTGHHVGLQIVPSGNPDQKWRYDFENMRLVTADGIEIPNAPKQLLDRMRAIVEPCLVPLNNQVSAPGLRHG
jgi:hypothetical protein